MSGSSKWELKADNEFFEAMKVIEELQAELEVSQKMYQGALDFSTRKEAENQALLAKNGELQAENKIWQEMVDSTNQTNQALIKGVCIDNKPKLIAN